MEKNKNWIGRLLEKIGNFFEGLFDAAESTWDDLQPEIQEAIVGGSRVLSIINQHVSKTPDEIIMLIQLAIPSLDREKLLAGLNKVAEGLNVIDAIEAESLEDTVANLAKYLESKQGGIWAGATALAAKVFAAFLAPSGTKWDIFESLMLFAYQTFVKKN